METLSDNDIDVYRTDLQGEVTLSYDGTGYSIEKEKETKVPEESEVAKEEKTEEDGVTYVLNTNSHKFHIPSCSSVDDMTEHNKEYFEGTREEAMEAGYEPCGRCKP